MNLAPQPEPKEHANFATAARLLSCLVSESLVPAVYRPLRVHRTNRVTVAGFATIFKGGVFLENSAFEADNILAVVPLHHAPIFKHDAVHDRHGHQIGLLNPLDMMFTVYETRNPQNEINDRYPIDVCSFLLPAFIFLILKVLTLTTALIGQCYSCYFGISCKNCTRVGS
jgi:hypothetical protein